MVHLSTIERERRKMNEVEICHSLLGKMLINKLECRKKKLNVKECNTFK